MSKQIYTPQPIDTTDVKLPAELEQLVEEMSKNVHEVWAGTRIKQVGRMANSVTMNLRRIRVLYHMKNCLKRKRSMTAILPSVH